jgi:uncharacterized protein YbaR (Trm112 family)
MIICPHCKAYKLRKPDVPKDVVVVLACPACRKWVVLFQGKAIPVDRRILMEGTFEERKTHIAEVIAGFLESGLGPFLERLAASGEPMKWDDFGERPASSAPKSGPITDEEVSNFARFELRKLDNAEYFRRHFG